MQLTDPVTLSSVTDQQPIYVPAGVFLRSISNTPCVKCGRYAQAHVLLPKAWYDASSQTSREMVMGQLRRVAHKSIELQERKSCACGAGPVHP
jgi:hypothetical protein